MINVTKTFLPPMEEYTQQLQRAWKKEWLTNRGELVLELEQLLKDHLKVHNILITNNGTVPLQIALKLLAGNGEVITTPFSYVATSAAIVWENCTPVFADIHPRYLTIDEEKIEALITDKTTAILATHVFGNPCDTDAIQSIAHKYGLKVIYDAAHSFGVTYNGQSVFNYGDVSTCSFHATKLFHTGEGGAIFTGDDALFHRLYYSHNFGHNGPLDFHGLGINGKISELQAAMGLAVFPHIGHIMASRKRAVEYYAAHLDFSILDGLTIRPGTEWNYSYYPVIFPSENILLDTVKKLNEAGIMPRRYFYPSLNTIPYTQGPPMPVSEKIASCILCLPLYASMDESVLGQITTIINTSIKN